MANKPVFSKFASKFSKQIFSCYIKQAEFDKDESLMADAVGEFLNLSNGILAVNYSSGDRKTDLLPQADRGTCVLVVSETEIVMPVLMSNGLLWIAVDKNGKTK